jgi:hypothetical protein
MVARRRVRQPALLVATAVGVILPYVFFRMEPRFWLPAAFVYVILLAGAIDVTARRLVDWWRRRALEAATR